MNLSTSVTESTDARETAEGRSATWENVQWLINDGLPLPAAVRIATDGYLSIDFDRLDEGQVWADAMGLDLVGATVRGATSDPTKVLTYFNGDFRGRQVALWVHEPASVLAAEPDPHANDHARCTPETCEEVQAQWLLSVKNAHDEGNHNACDPDDCEFGMAGLKGATEVYDATVEDRHAHGFTEREGLGFLADDPDCDDCCALATAALQAKAAEAVQLS